MRSMQDVMVGIDWSQQSPEAAGLVGLLDALQDAALADGVATEQDIFGVAP